MEQLFENKNFIELNEKLRNQLWNLITYDAASL